MPQISSADHSTLFRPSQNTIACRSISARQTAHCLLHSQNPGARHTPWRQGFKGLCLGDNSPRRGERDRRFINIRKPSNCHNRRIRHRQRRGLRGPWFLEPARSYNDSFVSLQRGQEKDGSDLLVGIPALIMADIALKPEHLTLIPDHFAQHIVCA